MIKKIRLYVTVALTALALTAPAVLPTAIAHADCTNTGNQIATGAGGASGNDFTCGGETGVSDSSISTLAKRIVNVFSIVVGAVSIIMIIYGGFRYITSGGASERVGSAKNTLIYAIIGLVIVALAQVIVHFVLFQTGQIANT